MASLWAYSVPWGIWGVEWVGEFLAGDTYSFGSPHPHQCPSSKLLQKARPSCFSPGCAPEPLHRSQGGAKTRPSGTWPAAHPSQPIRQARLSCISPPPPFPQLLPWQASVQWRSRQPRHWWPGHRGSTPWLGQCHMPRPAALGSIHQQSPTGTPPAHCWSSWGAGHFMLCWEIVCLFHLFPRPLAPNRGLTVFSRSTPIGYEPGLREGNVDGARVAEWSQQSTPPTPTQAQNLAPTSKTQVWHIPTAQATQPIRIPNLYCNFSTLYSVCRNLIKQKLNHSHKQCLPPHPFRVTDQRHQGQIES